MSKTYKGYELMKAIDNRELSLKQRVSSLSLDYINCTIDYVLKDSATNIMGLTFELIEDEINIQDIEHEELEILQEILGKCDLWEGNEEYILKVINENNSRLVDAILKVAKENEKLLKAIKQLDNKINNT